MLNIFARASVSRVTDPIGAWLLRRGLTPNTVTVLGTVGSVAAALWFLPRGELFTGAALVTAFVLFDLIDGAMARAQGGGTPFGAVLDATCDRIADGALFGAIAWWAFANGERALAAATLVTLVGALVTSYVKARAEASGLSADGGLAERAERFIVALVGVGLGGLGVPYILPVSLYLLAALVVVTVAQRIAAVHRSAKEYRT
ncbi:CDP-alcohol phosphatidyltransferase family protein [Saccharothrix violaceirubra]|uniref:Phosphatidylinositol phosphate synthase n=1 Tax=Saccharothrix violaceirubra TaxID=413306 RepID=A0A7W7WVA5_9PSEU|nr:CDP-alcohol phosphatidyltransferase family protein [Saccharothrix violaceirubra]MBB4964876.1 CDP-diacylglycerol--glycerol-3-phosphate 3-phosphatidyltransferase [Saccharothrix violaceirubra]